ncbi:unnamed protein product [Dicrocoelium dendriticum]|nr:unnamed protein product [Dicrocoelium dendriticum]
MGVHLCRLYVLWIKWLLLFEAYSIKQTTALVSQHLPFSWFNSKQLVHSQSLFEGKSTPSAVKRRMLLPELWIEILVFADQTVLQRFSSHHEAEVYVQTLMHVTNNLLQHPSLGINLSLVVRDIIWIDAEQSSELLWGSSLVRSLHRFCQWAMLRHYVRHGYDHAILLSRNIVQAAGISPLGQLCRIPHSCTLAEDSGFFSSYPIAHELMHSLGVEHDGEKNGCDRSGLTGNIMAPLILSTSYNYHWSDCTRLTLRVAMKLPSSLTLASTSRNPSNRHIVHPHWQPLPPYRLLYDEQGTIEESICQQLWCSVSGIPDHCDAKISHGLLEGTTCGPNRECYVGICAKQKRINKTVYHCGRYSDWTSCSRYCGIGTQFRMRRCHLEKEAQEVEYPNPQFQYKLCYRTQPGSCQTEEDFRAKQCNQFNLYKLHGVYHIWLPFVDYQSPCQLQCMSMQNGQVLNGSIPVRDGTLCHYNNLDHRCVQSQCVEFDCKGVVNGRGRRDKCGVCDGNGTTCKLVLHRIDRNLTIASGSRMVYLVPRMARRLEVCLFSEDHVLAFHSM